MSYTYEHEVKKGNGDKIYITIRYDNWRNDFRIVHLGLLPKRKRNIKYVDCTDDYTYRCMDNAGKSIYKLQEYLKYVTEDDIRIAVIKAWENMKPKYESNTDIVRLV